jgi:hypothetical protein
MNRARILSILFIAVVALGAALLVTQRQNPTKTGATPTPSATISPSASVYPVPESGKPTAAAWPTALYQKAFAGTVPPTPTLTAIRVGAHAADGYDRIAFDFTQPSAPGYTVQYVNQVVRDGSGQSVALTGKAFLQIVFNPAAAHNEAGGSTLSSPPTNPVATGYSELKSYVLNGDFEGHVSVALGLAGKNGFHVEEIHRSTNLWTVYIDVRR